MKTRLVSRQAGGLLLCMALLLPLGSPASAADAVKAADTVILAREHADAVIDAKGPNQITLRESDFKSLKQNILAVPYNPSIYDIDGRPILLQDLKVPCEATIDYKWVRGQDPVLMRIEVRIYEEGATTKFTLPEKPPRKPM